MKVSDCLHINGRGWIILCDNDESVHIGDKLERNGEIFEVVGIERMKTLKNMGLILFPNYSVPKNFAMGDELKFIK